MMPLPEARCATSKNSVKAKFGGATVRWGGFLRQLHCYKSQPLDTDRCNEWHQVGAFWPQRGASGAIVEGLTLRRGVACYRELLRIPLLRRWVNKEMRKGWVLGPSPCDHRFGLTASR